MHLFNDYNNKWLNTKSGGGGGGGGIVYKVLCKSLWIMQRNAAKQMASKIMKLLNTVITSNTLQNTIKCRTVMN